MAYTPVVFVALALVFAALGYRRARGRASLSAELTKWFLFFPIGLQGLWAFLGHVFFAQQTSASVLSACWPRSGGSAFRRPRP